MSAVDTKRGIETALKSFGAVPLQTAAFGLLEALGYKSQKRLPLVPNTGQTFLAQFGQARPFNAENALVAEWQSVDFLFQLTDDEIKAAAQGNQQFLFDSQGRWNGAAMESYLFFAISLSGVHYTRTQLSGITRAVNRLFDMPAMLLFRHGDTLTLAIINRRLHMRDESKDVLKKVTLIKDIRFANPHRAHIEILFDLSLDALLENHDLANFVQLHAAWQKTLDSSELNKRFFMELANWYFWALKHATFPKDAPKQDGKDHISVIRLITRLMFCWFVKEKGLIPDSLFDERTLPQILNGFEPGKANSEESVYYKAILQNLFFATLNTEMDKRGWTKEEQNFMAHSLYRFRELFQKPGEALALFKDIPFLNGGLFECLDKDLGEKANPRYQRIDGFSRRPDSQPVVPDFLFFGPEREVDLHNEYGDDKFKRVKVRGLIHTFGHYKFTITENTPIEEEIALDPELSGKVFENLLAAYNPETGATARKQTGSFYTPREIVNYMVDEALIACLRTKMQAPLPSAGDIEARLRHLFAYHNEPHRFTAAEVDTLIAAIDSLKSLDPAVGSGAFPMGILHKLVFILGRLDPDNTKWRERQRQRAIAETAEAFKIGDRDERERRLNDINEVFEQNASDYGRKLYLIENCIYGVDIQPIAVQIAKMRFFISLVADQKIEDAQSNRAVRPLPNLETKFVAANTLIGINRPGQQLLRNREIDAKEAELRRVRERHFLARNLAQKRKCREQDAKLREEIARLLRGDGWDNATAQKLASWDPYDQNDSAEFFDAEWMFGVCVGKQVRKSATTMGGNFSALVSDELTPESVGVEGFDVAIGNPPYISHDRLLDKHLFEKFETYEPFADIYCYFIERTIKLLTPAGDLSFITSNSYIKAEYGSPLRRFLGRKNAVLQLLNIEDSQIFDSAIVNVALLLVRASRARADEKTLVTNSACDTKVIPDYISRKSFQISTSAFAESFWTLAPETILKVKQKIAAAGPTLEKLDVKIRLGIATGSNEAFVITEEQRQAFLSKNQKNGDVIKPILRGRDINRYNYEVPGLYVLLTKNGINVKQDYPDIYRHLDSFGPGFKSRGAQGQNWWNLRACAFFDDFNKEKIVWIELTDAGRFALCREEIYLVNSAYFMLPPKHLDAKYLLAILNSRVIQFYLAHIAETSGMGTTRWINNYVKEFPIPHAQNFAKTALLKLVDSILLAKGKKADSDVSRLEREIDERVYSLYGLTPEEIKIVEEATSK